MDRAARIPAAARRHPHNAAVNAVASGAILFCREKYGAEGGIRTPTPYGATPSRWCVCQFRHFRKKEGECQKIVAGRSRGGKRRADRARKISAMRAEQSD